MKVFLIASLLLMPSFTKAADLRAVECVSKVFGSEDLYTYILTPADLNPENQQQLKKTYSLKEMNGCFLEIWSYEGSHSKQQINLAIKTYEQRLTDEIPPTASTSGLERASFGVRLGESNSYVDVFCRLLR